LVTVFGSAAGEQWLDKASRERGLPYYSYARRSALDPSCVFDIARECKRIRADVIHGHLFAMAVYGVAVGSLIRKPAFLTLHTGSEQTAALRRRIALRWAIRRSAGGSVVSEKMRSDLLVELGSSAKKLVTIPNGVPVPVGSRQLIRHELGIRDDELVVAAVGSCCHRKNHVSLIRACAALPQSIPWRLLIVGREDEASEDMRRLVADLSLAGQVHFLGVREDVGNILAATEVFAMPSQWEGLPLALLEAMAFGVASVATRVGGVPEVMRDGENGLLVDANEDGELTKALERLLCNAELRGRLAAQAQRDVRETYGSEKMCSDYERLYCQTDVTPAT